MSQELQKISEVLDRNPQILDLLLHDLCDTRDPGKGAGGLSPELVLRAAIVKQTYGFSYEQLAFHLADSNSFRVFVRLPLGWVPNKSTLQRNIAQIRATTWKQVNQILVGWAAQQKLEPGHKIRVDSTAVASHIHHPTDSELLYDGVRVLTRLLCQLRDRQQELEGAALEVRFTDHTRRAKRRRYQITNRRGAGREKAYRDLLKVSRRSYEYAERVCREAVTQDPVSLALLVQLRHFLGLVERVIDQTERRIVRGEKVPASQKVLSLFEEHTDIIKKGQREPVFGHKVFLTCTPTSLISNCLVLPGNPADSTVFNRLLEDHREVYGRSPRQMAADRGFYSGENLRCAQQGGVQDVSFECQGKVRIENMARSSWLYQQLRRFRAGIEGCISWLKRAFGLRRCTWKGWEHFQQYVHSAVVSCNLLVLARLLLR